MGNEIDQEVEEDRDMEGAGSLKKQKEDSSIFLNRLTKARIRRVDQRSKLPTWLHMVVMRWPMQRSSTRIMVRAPSVSGTSRPGLSRGLGVPAVERQYKIFKNLDYDKIFPSPGKMKNIFLHIDLHFAPGSRYARGLGSQKPSDTEASQQPQAALKLMIDTAPSRLLAELQEAYRTHRIVGQAYKGLGYTSKPKCGMCEAAFRYPVADNPATGSVFAGIAESDRKVPTEGRGKCAEALYFAQLLEHKQSKIMLHRKLINNSLIGGKVGAVCWFVDSLSLANGTSKA